MYIIPKFYIDLIKLTFREVKVHLGYFVRVYSLGLP